MSLLHESELDDQQLIRYLLGLLPEEAAELLDELTVADSEVADRLRAVEDDLVDDYVRGALAGESLERFESFYLASSRRRDKVNFARGFLQSVARAAEAASASDRAAVRTPHAPPHVATSLDRSDRRSGWRSLWRPAASPTWIFAAAAALLLAASATLLIQDLRLRTGLATARNEAVVLERRAQQLEQELKIQGEAHDKALAELDRVNASLAALAQQPPVGQPDTVSRALTTTLALVLLPQTRAIGQIPTLTVPPGTDRALFELRLESNDFSSYQVALKDPATNRILWQSVQLTVASPGDQPRLDISVPANLLRPQHYSFELTGRNAAGSPEIIGSYAVQILSP